MPGFPLVMTRPASGQVLKTRGSSRVGSGGVGNLTGRVGLGQDVFMYHGVGPGHPGSIRPAKKDPTHEQPWNIRPVLSCLCAVQRCFVPTLTPLQLETHFWEKILGISIGRVFGVLTGVRPPCNKPSLGGLIFAVLSLITANMM